jgi:hypothetical protein
VCHISILYAVGGHGEDSSSLLSASNGGSMDSVNNQLQISDDYDDDSFYVRSNGNISPNFWGGSSRREVAKISHALLHCVLIVCFVFSEH